MKNDQAPGPGYYNTSKSTFDLFDTSTGGNDTDFIMRLNAIRKRQSAVFESKSERDSILRDAIRRKDEPGV